MSTRFVFKRDNGRITFTCTVQMMSRFMGRALSPVVEMGRELYMFQSGAKLLYHGQKYWSIRSYAYDGRDGESAVFELKAREAQYDLERLFKLMRKTGFGTDNSSLRVAVMYPGDSLIREGVSGSQCVVRDVFDK